jgi:hypothetical protein
MANTFIWVNAQAFKQVKENIMFANCSMGGMQFAMPDVCLTPIPSPAGPIPTPIPYPNTAMLPMAIPPAFHLDDACS